VLCHRLIIFLRGGGLLNLARLLHTNNLIFIFAAQLVGRIVAFFWRRSGLGRFELIVIRGRPQAHLFGLLDYAVLLLACGGRPLFLLLALG